MLKERAKEVAFFVVLCDLVLLAVSFQIAYFLRFRLLTMWDPNLPDLILRHVLWLPLLSMPIFYVLFAWAGLYDSLRTRPLKEFPLLVARPLVVGGSVLGSVIFFVQAKYFSRSLFSLFLGIYYILLLSEKIVIRISQRYVRRRGFNYRTVLLVGINDSALRIASALREHREFGFKVVGFVNGHGQEHVQAGGHKILGRVDDLEAIVDSNIVDEIIFALPLEEIARCERQILKCEEVGLKIHIRADFAHNLFSRTYLGTVSGIPLLTLSSTPHQAAEVVIKRLIDLIASACGLLVSVPVMSLIAILIKCNSPGPVLFRQVRHGLNGRRFVLLKFRSMVHDAERQRDALMGLNKMSGPVFKIVNDPRVTSFGRFLRRTSLDELPQLWNVLRGDMSLVGPRPPLPAEVQKYARWQRRRLSMKPGLTCLWQVNGRNGIDFEDWMKLDLQYIDNWSLGLDLRILIRTIPAVIFSRGAH
jgi:exopolysaccharide biosynthesis polyprenyl glycosylphosphotransferase